MQQEDEWPAARLDDVEAQPVGADEAMLEGRGQGKPCRYIRTGVGRARQAASLLRLAQRLGQQEPDQLALGLDHAHAERCAVLDVPHDVADRVARLAEE